MTEKEKRNSLEQFYKMLDPNSWPSEYFMMHGEVYWYVPSGDPCEERICKPLFWKYQ